MAIPKKKSRLISVDGLEYRWLISFNHDAPFHRIVIIAVELSSSPGTKFIVYPFGVDVNYVDYDRGEPFTPKVVEQFIRRAREAGWKPSDPSGTFLLGDRPPFSPEVAALISSMYRRLRKERLRASIVSTQCTSSDDTPNAECEQSGEPELPMTRT